MLTALRCTLHRYSSRDINCRMCYNLGLAQGFWHIVSLTKQQWETLTSRKRYTERGSPSPSPASSCQGYRTNLPASPGRASQCHSQLVVWKCANDPSAGSPTETLLRLLLPLSDKVHETSCAKNQQLSLAAVRIIHRITQSVGATGGVYKGQGRNQHELMTRTY